MYAREGVHVCIYIHVYVYLCMCGIYIYKGVCVCTRMWFMQVHVVYACVRVCVYKCIMCICI